ncbi:hypothetical protein [Mycoplasmopsis columbinasalis]|uniref:ComE operon protein 1 n=1 Tax=Mycoplasmopsis columbinasalis TaxID=114880 RepID=A0A449BAE4_9BACT|nr:hypothetical protein [Mycoplasmopsis columbinasalis]VEU78181.1 Uncharacterised protein [Mycoplasmopsis columbinasalis]
MKKSIWRAFWTLTGLASTIALVSSAVAFNTKKTKIEKIEDFSDKNSDFLNNNTQHSVAYKVKVKGAVASEQILIFKEPKTIGDILEKVKVQADADLTKINFKKQIKSNYLLEVPFKKQTKVKTKIATAGTANVLLKTINKKVKNTYKTNENSIPNLKELKNSTKESNSATKRTRKNNESSTNDRNEKYDADKKSDSILKKISKIQKINSKELTNAVNKQINERFFASLQNKEEKLAKIAWNDIKSVRDLLKVGINANLAKKIYELKKIKGNNVTWADIDQLRGVGEKTLETLQSKIKLSR